MTDKIYRGEFNNNPGNINYLPKNAFNGQLGIEIVQPGHSYTPRFGRYDTAINGIRALAKQLLKYQNTYKLNTIKALTRKWAPDADGNVSADYSHAVSQHSSISEDQVINLNDIETLIEIVTAFIFEENGRCNYPPETIEAACRSALGL